jgi:hypothetical protein
MTQYLHPTAQARKGQSTMSQINHSDRPATPAQAELLMAGRVIAKLTRRRDDLRSRAATERLMGYDRTAAYHEGLSEAYNAAIVLLLEEAGK